jgi:hypothetical protein
VKLTDFLHELTCVLKPHRTEDGIRSRLAYLEGRSEAERDEIIERWSQEAAFEERFFKARVQPERAHTPAVDQCTCVTWEPPPLQLNPDVDLEIAQLNALLPSLVEGLFGPCDLAVLRAEMLEFYMRERYILIGRGTMGNQISVNLGFIAPNACVHISREQASIQLMSDGHFYIENVGSAIFRANGKIIKPKQYAVLPTGALLDFCGIILLFVPNTSLVQQIVAQLTHE